MIALEDLRPLKPENCWSVDTAVYGRTDRAEFFDGVSIRDLRSYTYTIDAYAAGVIERFTGWLTSSPEFEFAEMNFLEGLGRYFGLRHQNALLDEADQASDEELYAQADVQAKLPKARAEDFRWRVLGHTNGFIRAHRAHLAAIVIPEGTEFSFGRYEDTHGVSPGRIGAKLHRLAYDDISDPAVPAIAHVLRGRDNSIGLVPDGYEVARIGWVDPSSGARDIEAVKLDTIPPTHIVRGGAALSLAA